MSYPSEVSFYGLNISNFDSKLIQSLLASVNNKQSVSIHFLNSYSIYLARKESDFYRTIKEGLLLCDSRPLAVHLRGTSPSLIQSRGIDVLRELIQASSDQVAHFFIGSTPTVQEAILTNAKADNPQVRIVGQISPPYQNNLDHQIHSWVDAINLTGANLIWIGLGTPKQDYVARKLASQLQGRVILSIGAAFDFYSGRFAESPIWIRRIGLEWFFRLIQEPRRLFSRYLFSNSFLLFLILKDHLKRLRIK